MFSLGFLIHKVTRIRRHHFAVPGREWQGNFVKIRNVFSNSDPFAPTFPLAKISDQKIEEHYEFEDRISANVININKVPHRCNIILTILYIMYLPIQVAQLTASCHRKLHHTMARLGSAKELGLLRHGRSNHVLPDGFVIKVGHLNLSPHASACGVVQFWAS